MGPFWSHFHQSWVQADQAMRALHPGLDASFLAADTYYTKAMQEVKSELTSMNRYDILGRINALRVERVNNLEAIANTVTIAATKGQTIDEGLLNTPPFYYQGDMTNEYSKYSADDHRRQGCANACFRMVCSDLIGLPIRHEDVVAQLRKHFGSHLIDNYQYLNFFHSTALNRFTGRSIATIDMLGADFNSIAGIARGARNRWPGCNVYCITPLGSEAASKTIMHQGVLLAVDENSVTYHDPSGVSGKAERTIPKIDFVQRWARGLNQAMFVIA